MKVLVAEDDPVTLEAVGAVLRGEGFEVVEVADGEAALRAWKAERPDLMCLDIMMPGIDGFEVCRRVRREDGTLPVIFLSAKSEEVDVVVGLELGADDFVRKPFGKHELLARLKSVLRRAGASGKRERRSFQMGGMRVFPAELRAELGNEEVELTAREVSILGVLQKREGEVVPRDVLLDECWGVDYFPESRTLDQHIAKLRKKVDLGEGEERLIETVRGVGYRYRGVVR